MLVDKVDLSQSDPPNSLTNVTDDLWKTKRWNQRKMIAGIRPQSEKSDLPAQTFLKLMSKQQL